MAYTQKRRVKKRKQKKPTEPFIINDEVFTIKGLQERMKLLGEDPATYRKHPDYQEYMKQMQQRRLNNLAEKKQAIKEGKLDPKTPLTNHPDAINQYMVESPEEQDEKLEHKIKKSCLDTLESMEMLKKVAKSKVPSEIKAKIRGKRVLNELDTECLDLDTLEQITKIVAVASKSQLEVAIKILDQGKKKDIKKKLKLSIANKNMKNKLEGQDSFFDFKQIEQEVDLADKLSTNMDSKEDVLKSLDKLFN